MRQYLKDESVDKLNVPFDESEWEDVDYGSNAPQQDNFRDCGVFACQYMKWLVDDVFPNFKQEHIAVLRDRMVWEIKSTVFELFE